MKVRLRVSRHRNFRCQCSQNKRRENRTMMSRKEETQRQHMSSSRGLQPRRTPSLLKKPRVGRGGGGRERDNRRGYNNCSKIMADQDQEEYQLEQWDASYQLLDLPLELQNHILSFCNAKELYNVSLVCQDWRELAMQDVQWKLLCKGDFEFLTAIFEVKKPRSVSWRLWWKFLGRFLFQVTTN